MIARTPARVGAAHIAVGLSAATLLVAALVHLLCAPAARDRLRYGFAGLPAELTTTGSIFAGNLRLLAGLLATGLLLNMAGTRRAGASRGLLVPVVRAASDTLVALTVALNVVVVGAALGAYGSRMLLAILPHGPLELAAYAPALALYLRARHEPLARRAVLLAFARGGLALALAAVLETYVAL